MTESDERDFERRLATQMRREMDSFMRPYDPAVIARRAMGQRAGTSRPLNATPLAFTHTLVVATIVLAFLATVAGLGLWNGPAGGAPSPTPSPTATVDVLSLPTAWPPLPADPTLTASCMADLPPTDGLIFQDRRSEDFALVMLRHGPTVATCSYSRAADGTPQEYGGEPADPWKPGEGIAVGSAGLTIDESTDATDDGGWSNIMGLAPAQATSIRLVVGGRAAVAVMADGFYSIGWQSTDDPSLLVAYDAAGVEVDRIGQAGLDRIFNNPCQPESLEGCASATP